MEFTRRGFLQTLAASVAGAAVFDPKSLLWLPKTAPVEIVASAEVEQQLELNDLALRFAQSVGVQLQERHGHKPLILQDVMYQHTGSTMLPANALSVAGKGHGFFEPSGRVMTPTIWPTAPQIPVIAREYLSRARAYGDNAMFAPIGTDLRPGSPFQGVQIGLGTDPATGLSARVIRYDHQGKRNTQTMTGFELAGGSWETFDAPFYASFMAKKPTWMSDAEAHKAALRGSRFDEYGDPYFDDDDVADTEGEG